MNELEISPSKSIGVVADSIDYYRYVDNLLHERVGLVKNFSIVTEYINIINYLNTYVG